MKSHQILALLILACLSGFSFAQIPSSPDASASAPSRSGAPAPTPGYSYGPATRSSGAAPAGAPVRSTTSRGTPVQSADAPAPASGIRTGAATTRSSSEAAGSERDDRREEWTLWPGESYTFLGVTVTWEVSPDEKESTGPLGTLVFKGPKTTLRGIPSPIVRTVEPVRPSGLPPGSRSATVTRVQSGMICAYLDDTVIQISGRVAGPTANLMFNGERQASRQVWSGAPKTNQVYVSNACPVAINEWTLRVSDKPVKYADGTEYLELAAVGGETGTKLTLPLANGAMRRFGRFEVRVGNVWKATRAAEMIVQAQPDRSIQGGDTYVDRLVFEGHSVGEILDRLGEKFEFKVEWLAVPGHPESVEFGRSWKYPQESQWSGVTIKDAIRQAFPDRFVLDWKTPRLLQVSVKDYDRVLAQNEKERQRQEQVRQLEAKREAQQERFRQEYVLVTRVYALKKMSAVTAMALINSEMTSYYLVGPGGLGEEGFHVLPARGSIPSGALASVSERCFADEKTNSIIVSALPSTLAKLESILREFDKAEETKEPQSPVGRYRIEVILLQGGKAGEEIEEVARGTRLSFAVAGLIRNLPVKAGDKVKAGDVIARLDPSEQELRLRKAEAELSSAAAQIRAVEDTYARTTKLVETGRATQAEASQAEAALATARAQYDAGQASLQSAKLQLSYCTLLAPTSGTVTSVPVNASERIEPGQVVATLMLEAKAASKAGKGPGVFTPELAAQYGISQEDLKLFGFDAVAEMGKGLVTLSAGSGPTGRALVSLSEAYRCEIEFQDVRPPYVIVRGRLLSAQSDKPVLENTLFLEKGKPSVLGLTNLRQALILVLRLLDSPSGSVLGARSRVAAPTTAKTGTSTDSTRSRSGR